MSIFDDTFNAAAVRATAHYHRTPSGGSWACWGLATCPNLDRGELGPCEVAGCDADADGVSRRCTAHLLTD